MNKIITLVFFFIINSSSFAQLSAGVAYGTFNTPGAERKLRGTAPTLSVTYTGDEETQQLYFDASLYKKEQTGFETSIYDDQGMYIGSAQTTKQYSIIHLQLGFKRSFAGNFDDSKFNGFVGGGIALSFNKVSFKYDYSGYKIPDDEIKRTMVGFHFSTGGQLHLKPVIIEIRGNFDLVLKPITIEGGDNKSNLLTSLRLGVLVPLTKHTSHHDGV